MKSGILYFFILFFLLSCGNSKSKMPVGNKSGNDGGKGKAQIEFENYEHDFGRVTQGEKVGWYFSYKNTGDDDLIITKVSASCGCTVPEYSKKPLGSGEETRLKVIYDSKGRSGREIKTVTVESNADTPVVKLKLKIEVIQ